MSQLYALQVHFYFIYFDSTLWTFYHTCALLKLQSQLFSLYRGGKKLQIFLNKQQMIFSLIVIADCVPWVFYSRYSTGLYKAWTASVGESSRFNLSLPLISRDPDTQLISVNFNPQVWRIRTDPQASCFNNRTGFYLLVLWWIMICPTAAKETTSLNKVNCQSL